MNQIELKRISKTYNPNSPAPVQALRSVELAVQRGELIAIQGRSGSGKSTLLNIMGCLDRASSGQYLLNGQDVCALSAARLAYMRCRTFGFVLQQYGLLPDHTALQNVSIPLMFARFPLRRARSACEDMLARVGLADKARRKASEMSGGEQQRVAIARALVCSPEIILADEPTGNLDSRTADSIMRLFHEIHAEGRTVVIVTHDDSIAAQCGRTVTISDGTVEQ